MTLRRRENVVFSLFLLPFASHPRFSVRASKPSVIVSTYLSLHCPSSVRRESYQKRSLFSKKRDLICRPQSREPAIRFPVHWWRLLRRFRFLPRFRGGFTLQLKSQKKGPARARRVSNNLSILHFRCGLARGTVFTGGIQMNATRSPSILVTLKHTVFVVISFRQPPPDTAEPQPIYPWKFAQPIAWVVDGAVRSQRSGSSLNSAGTLWSSVVVFSTLLHP